MVQVSPGGICKTNLEVGPAQTHECANLMACTADEKECMVSTLLRWAPCTRGITAPSDQFRADTLGGYVKFTKLTL